MDDDKAAAQALLTAGAVRERAHEMLALCEADKLAHWRIDRARLPATAQFVLDTMRENYPDLRIPFHARWRHFSAGGKNRWAAIERRVNWPDAAARARAEFDLAIVSVLLDAGAGVAWSYREADGTRSARSEGLAIASLDMFAAGLFSARPDDPLRADAARLAALTEADLAQGFQSSADNPLVGLPGRVALLNALGRACLAAPDVFASNDDPRPGGLFDGLLETGSSAAIPYPLRGRERPRFTPELRADAILVALLRNLGAIWPSRLTLGAVPLGDAWRHEAIRRDDSTNGIVPFHKLSQWLAYSLIEPLQRAGCDVVDIDALTGLPEYRNGGLLVDCGALAPKDAAAAARPHGVDSAFIVEWRALTVALLDETGRLVRAGLGMDAREMPLARVLEGGTWAAGRRMAARLRPDGSPPLHIVSDGTVF